MAVPQVVINLPQNVPSQTVWVRYALYDGSGSAGEIGRGITIKAATASQHISAALGDGSARYAKLVIYAPGCKFARYEFELAGTDISVDYRCELLATQTIHGSLNRGEIPSSTIPTEKKFDIAAFLNGQWVCRLFLQAPDKSGASMMGGSCLGSDIPLGIVGEIERNGDGSFEITIPDFTNDPVFAGLVESGRFGLLALALQERQSGRILGTIREKDAPDSGLGIRTHYPNYMAFTRVR